VFLAAWVGRVPAQEPADAEALLVRAQETLLALPHVEVTATVRNLHLALERGPGGDSGGLRVLNADYQQIAVRRRQPEDWRVVSQREREVNGRAFSERKVVLAKVGEADGEALILNTLTKEPARVSFAPALFRQEILERAGGALAVDPVLKALLFDRENSGSLAHGLAEVAVAGTDEVGALRFTKVSAQARGARITVWIDASTGLIVRAISSPANAGMMRRVTETIYAYDFLRGSEKADFDLHEGWQNATGGISAGAGFVPVEELFALTGAPAPVVAAAPGLRPEGRPTTPAALNGSGAGGGSVLPAASGQQLLTPLQMESIVLIESDDGAGSGFVAKIRGVDFVVTNLHVVGGNDKIRVTTLRGVTVKVGAVFGASGRDIALLRIEGENTVPGLAIAGDPVASVRIGDRVAVVGNRRGGGVATQVSGVVRGIGPDRIEVDAPFQPGNSGSPIVHLGSGEVIGLATYSQVRSLDELDKTGSATSGGAAVPRAESEQRWFGYRADGVAKWEALDMEKWRAQAKRVADFSADSEAIFHAMNGRFRSAYSNPRVRLLVDRLEERLSRSGASQALALQEAAEFFRGLRSAADVGVKDLKTGDYYDFFRTSLYWETSITQQLRAREELARRLDQAAENTTAFVSKLRR
jgi:hypothetical protein